LGLDLDLDPPRPGLRRAFRGAAKNGGEGGWTIRTGRAGPGAGAGLAGPRRRRGAPGARLSVKGSCRPPEGRAPKGREGRKAGEARRTPRPGSLKPQAG
jgi:hypothetical protein